MAKCEICLAEDDKYFAFNNGKIYCRRCITFKGEKAKINNSSNNEVILDLKYNLSKKLAGKLHLRGAKLFVQARNLGLIYCANDYGYDPEWLPGSNKPSATIAFGANINF